MKPKITRRHLAQRARRDAEREQSEPRLGPPSIPHGTEVGEVRIILHGQVVVAKLLQAGERCRTYGVAIDGAKPELMGLYRAVAEVSRKIARVPGRRSDFWD